MIFFVITCMYVVLYCINIIDASLVECVQSIDSLLVL